MLSNPFVPSVRKPRFHVYFKIHDLMNVPLVSGDMHVKWSVNKSTLTEEYGRTQPASIKEHRVVWDYEREIEVKMLIDRQQCLVSRDLILEIIQEIPGGRDRNLLGTIRIDLSRYASVARDTRRYLLQDSKVNSTLRVTIALHQLSGNSNFIAKPLAKDYMFGGIAGILQDGIDLIKPEKNQLSFLSHNHEFGILHEPTLKLYRQALLCGWSCDQVPHSSANEKELISEPFSLIEQFFTPSSRNAKASVDKFENDYKTIENNSSLLVYDLGHKIELTSSEEFIKFSQLVEEKELRSTNRSWTIPRSED